LLLVVSLGLSLVATVTWANAADISGNWAFTIERATGPVNATCIFKEAGEKVSGTYSGRFGEYQVIGSVKGDLVVFRWEIPTDGGKRPPTVTFEGKLVSPAKMTGTVEVPYCPEGQKCKWTATKK
jgi:hypothetical protein